jgi:hypothetical protein
VTGELRLLLSEDEADPERVETLTRLLREDLLQVDVRDVTALRAGQAPSGARALDAVAIGGLLVTLGPSVKSLSSVIGAIRNWLSRGQAMGRTIRMEIEGDVLELSAATRADQDRLVTLFVERHSGRGG